MIWKKWRDSQECHYESWTFDYKGMRILHLSTHVKIYHHPWTKRKISDSIYCIFSFPLECNSTTHKHTSDFSNQELVEDDVIVACALECQNESITHWFVWKEEMHRDDCISASTAYLATQGMLLLKCPYWCLQLLLKCLFWIFERNLEVITVYPPFL